VTAVAVTAVTAVIVGICIARAVTAVIIVPAVTAVTRRAFVMRPGGSDHRGCRDRRDWASFRNAPPWPVT
jgi:hypothetical protein